MFSKTLIRFSDIDCACNTKGFNFYFPMQSRPYMPSIIESCFHMDVWVMRVDLGRGEIKECPLARNTVTQARNHLKFPLGAGDAHRRNVKSALAYRTLDLKILACDFKYAQ
jgi:hypothetical protein